jgi:hypothetical protein
MVRLNVWQGVRLGLFRCVFVVAHCQIYSTYVSTVILQLILPAVVGRMGRVLPKSQIQFLSESLDDPNFCQILLFSSLAVGRAQKNFPFLKQFQDAISSSFPSGLLSNLTLEMVPKNTELGIFCRSIQLHQNCTVFLDDL